MIYFLSLKFNRVVPLVYLYDIQLFIRVNSLTPFSFSLLIVLAPAPEIPMTLLCLQWEHFYRNFS